MYLDDKLTCTDCGWSGPRDQLASNEENKDRVMDVIRKEYCPDDESVTAKTMAKIIMDVAKRVFNISRLTYCPECASEYVIVIERPEWEPQQQAEQREGHDALRVDHKIRHRV